MLTSTANEDIRTSFWPRVREFAVPASMIETATARRLAGDWAGACAAAGFDVDLNLRAVARDHGRERAARVRSDLRALAPDLLRWHMPRIAPDGLLRPGVTLTLAQYDAPEGPVHLVARTAPAWADAGQRISLALWSRSTADAAGHPHPRPNRRFRLDLHRHLWDAGRAGELGARSGGGEVRGWSAAGQERGWGGEVRDRDGAGEARERPGTGDVRERGRGGEVRDRDAEVHDWTVAGGGYDRTGTSQTRDRNGAGDTRDRTGAAEAGDQTATSQTHHQTGTGEVDDRTGTSQTRDRARTGQIPDPSEAAEGHNQTGTSQTPDRTGTDELRQGSDVGEPSIRSQSSQLLCDGTELTVPAGCAVERWAAEARILLAAEGRTGGLLLVRLGGRRRLVLELAAGDGLLRPVPTPPAGAVSALPVLPDAATWELPDLQLLRAGAIEAERLHPLVAAALAPDRTVTGPPRTPDRPGRPRLVECRGARHRIGLVDGVLAPLDHDPDEIRREELLVALTGTPLPCLQAIDEAHRRPHCLAGVRERLVHGDTAGALAVVEGLLGPEALLRTGPLRDALEAAALRRITYGLFRAGLTGPGPTRFRPRPSGRDPRIRRTHPRHAI
ncbi:hypothetical protein ACIF85_38345 [Streptomyces sp. NPDC086033]|uniref:hypothetical protein n=1 Tax=Streptomyces sp. NPDC086033 TaxID=3365747 RepID=UPI0037D64DE2